GDKYPFPAAKPDKVLHDGAVIALGDTRLMAHRTPGHTKGCTTWTTTEEGHPVVIVCSTTAPGYQLAGNAAYPRMVEDFRASFRIFASLPCDIFLGSHGSFFGLTEK